jgi:hypothetical protein
MDNIKFLDFNITAKLILSRVKSLEDRGPSKSQCHPNSPSRSKGNSLELPPRSAGSFALLDKELTGRKSERV